MKNLYEFCFDLVIYILLKFCETEEGEVNYEASSMILASFVKHTRMHMHKQNNLFCL